jgi:hypothetical protein
MSTESGVGTRPTAEATTWRALALVSLLFRDNLERELGDEARPRGVIEKLNTLLLEWMDRESVRAHLSRRERALVETPLGGWDERAIGDVSWRIEGVGSLLWAVGMVDEIPAYDRLFELDGVMPSLNVFQESGPLIARVRLRPPDELDAHRDVAEVWHWRARTAELQRRSGLQPAPQNLQAALQRAVAAGAFAAAADGDFPAFGKPYRDLTADELTTCGAISRERHHALDWLCGRSADWDDPTSAT